MKIVEVQNNESEETLRVLLVKVPRPTESTRML